MGSKRRLPPGTSAVYHYYTSSSTGTPKDLIRGEGVSEGHQTNGTVPSCLLIQHYAQAEVRTRRLSAAPPISQELLRYPVWYPQAVWLVHFPFLRIREVAGSERSGGFNGLSQL